MRRSERGAALVEYALIVALLAVVLIGAIQSFEDGAEDRYGDRSAQGDPGEEFGNLGPTDGGTSGGTDGSPPPGGSVASAVVEALTAVAPASNNTWSMTVTVRVLGDGEPLGGVTFTAPTWAPSSGGTSTCTTTSTGICTYTQTMQRTGGSAVPSAAFTIGTPSYTNPDNSSPSFSGPGNPTIGCAAPDTGSGSGACA